MPKYTATVNRSVTRENIAEKVVIEAADDAEANRKLRDTEFPTARSMIVDITIVPWTNDDDVDPPKVDGQARPWVKDDDHVTMHLYRSDLEGESFLNAKLDQEVWQDLKRGMSHLTLMDMAYALLEDQWSIGPGRPPPDGWDLPPPLTK